MSSTGGSGTAPAPPSGFFEILCSHLDEGVLIVCGDVVRFANPAAQAALQMEGDRVGSRLIDAVGDYRLSLLLEACRRDRAEGTRELIDRLTDRHVVARAVPMRAGAAGDDTEVAVILRDETRLRRLEKVRRDFVANVSHELRTPIAAIQLLVETLQDGAMGDPDAAGVFVAKIGLEVSHMAQMVSELLELSAIESGEQPLRVRPVAAEELLRSVERLRPLADERGVTLATQVGATEDIAGDAARLGQVLRNLVHNAIKFTPSGGRITVRAEPGDAGWVRLEVEDTGVGIAPDDVARIFERFWKADRSRQRDGEGTGLGLAIARHVVHAHGGTIGVRSAPDQGSTFSVVLPSAPRTAAAPAP